MLTGDLREHDFAGRTFELVTGTPPYFLSGTGTESKQTHAAPCRFEHRGGVEDYLRCAATLLSATGRLVMCASALERARIRAAAAEVGLRPTSHLDVVPLERKAALITVDVFTRAAGSTDERTESTLTVRDSAHQWKPAFSALRQHIGLPPTAPRRSAR